MSPMKHVAPEIIAALMEQPRTESQLREYTGFAQDTVISHLREFHARGVIHRAGLSSLTEDGKKRHGRAAVVWALQSKPFNAPDAV